MKKARVIAVYLPQFHPIPENDLWWGKGFTEWTNVRRAKPLFRGHEQPRQPSDLGFYDLLDPQVRERQASLAREAGIEGFCYWHYWFGNGKRLLEKPFEEVLSSGRPDFPFCLAWANHSWSDKTWTALRIIGEPSRILMEQSYPGESDFIGHFQALLPAFRDRRYIRVDGKPVFFIYDPYFPQVRELIRTWRRLAREHALPGIHFVAMIQSKPLRMKESLTQRIAHLTASGFDAVNTVGTAKAEQECSLLKAYAAIALPKYLHIHHLVRYKQTDINRHFFSDEDRLENVYPTALPNWDRSPRCGKDCVVYTDSTPEAFAGQMQDAVGLVKDKAEEHRLILVRSWNEWGEGNYLEPDVRYGHGYLGAIKKSLE